MKRATIFECENYAGLTREDMDRIQAYVASLSKEEQAKLLNECDRVRRRLEAEARAALSTICLTPTPKM